MLRVGKRVTVRLHLSSMAHDDRRMCHNRQGEVIQVGDEPGGRTLVGHPDNPLAFVNVPCPDLSRPYLVDGQYVNGRPVGPAGGGGAWGLRDWFAEDELEVG